MIQLTEALWIGDSDDAYLFTEKTPVTGVLNVAHDIEQFAECAYPDVEYMQVGLVDGPGNEVVGYCTAVLALVTLARRHEVVAVYDHSGGRALAVAMMYLNLVEGKFRPDPLSWSHWLTWGERLAEISSQSKLPKTELWYRAHTAHIEAFAKLPYGVMEALL